MFGSFCGRLSPSEHNKNRTIGALLFLTLSSFYTLLLGGHIYTPDGVSMFRVTESLVTRGQISIPDTLAGFDGQRVVDRNGVQKFYSKFGLGLSLAAVPGYVFGRFLEKVAYPQEWELFYYEAPPPDMSPQSIKRELEVSQSKLRVMFYPTSRQNAATSFAAFGASLTAPLLTSLTVVGIFLVAQSLGYEALLALIVAVISAIATPLLVYSKDFFSESLSACCFIFALLFAIRGKAHRRSCNWFLCGVFMGLGVLAKAADLIVIPLVLVTLACYEYQSRSNRPLSGLVAFMLGLFPGLGIYAGYNYLRFGSFVETGYGSETELFITPFLEGLIGLLLSPGRGLFIYFPLSLLGLAGLRKFYSHHKPEAIFIIGVFLSLLALYSRWHQWEGGWCWGPRFLLPSIPLLMLLTLPIFKQILEEKSTVARFIIVLFLPLAIAISVSGTIVNYVDFGEWIKVIYYSDPSAFLAQGIRSYYSLIRWDFEFAPIVAYWNFPRKDFFLLPQALLSPGVIRIFFLSSAVVFFVSVLGLHNAMIAKKTRSGNPMS